MNRLVMICALGCLGFVASGASGQSLPEGFRPLFNGRDLTGWVPVNTAPSTWTVEEGMLVCSGRPIGELRTERMYQNFMLEVEWRHMVPKGNAGIFIWADDITAKGQPFHRGIEVQVLENAYGNTDSYTTHGDIFPIHGATMTPVNGRGGSRAFPTENRSKPSPEWNHYRITCQDGNITLAVNGKVVTEGRDCSPRKGYICLESEGGVVHYRNLIIKELPDTPIAAEHVAIADRGYRCLYSGVDFAGWKLTEAQQSHWHSRDWILAFDGAADDPGLVTAESFGDGRFIVDVRWSKNSQSLELRLRDHDGGAIRLAPDDPSLEGKLNTNGWNRIEGHLQRGELSVSVNGQQWQASRQLTGLPRTGPLRIACQGPMDLANIYVSKKQRDE